ncbi:hypothetical protein [Klebsiella quasipneumoniae]|uniref:hypothetical protein n=1 Tax=Klebsiella quasipneumoniae TaxID=1463165 RepID=UPI000C79F4D4|nr:hypothetical protein [Klebsiella quasipneumoniae]PLD67588.1 hypothetical protein B6I57_01845 [Klebsiella quasipneumoniae]PLF07384.1 hypothetical protein B6I82_15925 [Klebsiella quasipneumoniae]
MTSKYNIDNRELLQRISCGEAVAGIDFGNLIVRELAAFRLAAMDQKPAIHRYRRKAVEPYGPYPWHYEEFVDLSRPLEGIEDEYYYAAPPAVSGFAVDGEPTENHIGSKNALDTIVSFIKSKSNPTVKCYEEVSEQLFKDNCHGIHSHVIEYILKLGEELEDLRAEQDEVQPAPVVQCPYPCGWDTLNKLAIQDAAFVSLALVAGEPATESIRQAAITNSDRLLKVISACRAGMLHGSEPVTTTYKLPDDFDFDRFNDVTWLDAVATNPHMHSLTTSIIAMVALELNKRLEAGNSPAIPDGSEHCPCCGKKLRRACSVEGCGGMHVAHGLCQKHYDMKRWEDPEQVERFREAGRRYRGKKKSTEATTQEPKP